MINVMDWLLEKMRLVEENEESIESESEQGTEVGKNIWTEFAYWKKDKMLEQESRIYFKNVQAYADCKLVINNYKAGAVCIYSLEPDRNSDAQGMMNYICGGVYALEGEVMAVGENVFMTVSKEDKQK